MYRWVNWAFKYINRRSPILIHTPWVRNIGNCAEDMYFGLLKAKREGKKVAFLFHRYELFWKFRLPVANRELFLVESDYIAANDNAWGRLGGWLLTLVFSLIRISYVLWHSFKLRVRLLRSSRPVFFDAGYTMPLLGSWSLWQPEGATAFSWETVETLKWKQQYDEYLPPTLSTAKLAAAERLRVQMGVPLSNWFACLHVREGGFRRGDTSGNPRNASIQRYFDGIKAITGAGGWVVRLGDPSMTPLPPMPRVIDYPHAQFKSELMDIYLISQCRVFVGTNSGPSSLAELFRRPAILVNLTEWSNAFAMRKGDLAIIKHVFSRSRGRFLSLKEILDEPFGCQQNWPGSDEYMMFENRPEEIRDVIEEFLNRPEGHQLSGLQEAFNRGRSRQIHRWLDQGEPFWQFASEEERVLEQYRIASHADSAAGSLGQKYLEQNWLEDRMNFNSAR
jgi:putative glycosyltransferase (TIGR04372 family)